MARERHTVEQTLAGSVDRINRNATEPAVHKGRCYHPKACPLDSVRQATAPQGQYSATSVSHYTINRQHAIHRSHGSSLRSLVCYTRSFVSYVDDVLTSLNSAIAGWSPGQYQPWHPRQWSGQGGRWGNNGQPPLDYRVGCTCDTNQQEDPWTGHKACDQLSRIWGNLYWDDDNEAVSLEGLRR